MELKPIHQQVVVLMGASSGIGRATALEFGRRGARVFVAARDREGLESLAEEIRGNGGEAGFLVGDASDADQTRAVGDAAFERFGAIDTWVQLAAVSLYATFEQTTPE